MQLLQSADELIKELRVSCLAALQGLAHAQEGQSVSLNKFLANCGYYLYQMWRYVEGALVLGTVNVKKKRLCPRKVVDC